MDLQAIASATRRYNFHSHTQFCDGRDTMEHFAAQACDEGFLHYGFSPHSPLPGVASPCNMSAEQVPVYLAEAKRLRELYQGKMSVYASMEIDYMSENWNAAIPYFQELPLDYRISSIHFLKSPDGYVDIDGNFLSFRDKLYKHFHDDIRGVVEQYYTATAKMIELGGFDIIGHFDKIGLNASYFDPEIEQQLWYLSLVDNIIRLIADRGLIIEINTKAREQHGRFFPAERRLPQIIEAGIPIVVNSDAHYIHLLDASRQLAFDAIEAARCVALHSRSSV